MINMADNKEMITIPLSKGEWNTILHALTHKTTDLNNSKLAQSQYEGLHEKLTDKLYY